MRQILLLIIFVLLITNCSKEEPTSECSSCEIQNQKVSFCENKDGTYHLQSRGESLKYTSEDLEAMKITFEEMKEQSCQKGEILRFE